MELKEVVKLLHDECDKHFKNGCIDCKLSGKYLCQDIMKLKSFSSEKIVNIENVCIEIKKQGR